MFLRHVTKSVAPVLAAGAVLTLALSSQARTLPGLSATAQDPAFASCIKNSAGKIFNTCASTRQVCVGLPVDNAQTHRVRINGRRKNGSTLRCTAWSRTVDGLTLTLNPWVDQSVVDRDVTLHIGNVAISPSATAFACCDMGSAAITDSDTHLNGFDVHGI